MTTATTEVCEIVGVLIKEDKPMTLYDIELRFSKAAIFRIQNAVNAAVKAGHLKRKHTSIKVRYIVTALGRHVWNNPDKITRCPSTY